MLETDCILVDSFCEEHRESEEDTTLKIPVKEFYEQMANGSSIACFGRNHVQRVVFTEE